jgi:hypothetical protein
MGESILLAICLTIVVVLVFLLVWVLVRPKKPVDGGHYRAARRESHRYGREEESDNE